MAQTGLFLGFVLGVVLLALTVFLTGRGWRHYSVTNVPVPTGGRSSGGTSESTARRWADDPTVLSLVFLLAALGFGAVAVLFVGGSAIPESVTSAAGPVLVAGTLTVVVAYLFYGTYHAARGRGLTRSQATLLGSWVLGLLFVVGVALRLVGLL
ncbi:hypothetical protein C5B91_06610 [Haloferax sp. Atlit-10N]|uniref:Uncharacterized protein n=1 Tax=Haloferax prahovense (strain DSM 18310 / JCM 13924 / TL6) TaxID=1227461 RepID=M0GDW2_HALPT|nr:MULTISPECIES: hypothetical protein [Haloferax]ELZ70466.1 hypothetical protein C457_08444 [Haloferax prahovense DSM 18310]RDZ45395.1 hypothetical protein C5B86_06500 [Haloferax sp. Atlit-19N]RDZ47330.1 hypothetical protein C5B87_06605 [Haloferax sp. Atlit-16N]RDZ61164.1 hypothetical protein C5B91_06610 [Haloferax sp. Atlit-10N]